MLSHINNIKADLKYKIVSEEERSIANEILKHYKSELSQNYFKDYLSTDSKIINPKYYNENEAYFFSTLSTFLGKHSSKYDFCGIEVCITKSYESHISTCELTEAGIVYYKLYYLVQLFCESIGLSYIYSDRLKETLDTKQVKFIHYRP